MGPSYANLNRTMLHQSNMGPHYANLKLMQCTTLVRFSLPWIIFETISGFYPKLYEHIWHALTGY